MKLLNNKEADKIKEQLNEQYGISELNGIMFETSKEKIRLFTGNLTKDEINRIIYNIRTELIGIYLGKRDKDSIRLSFDSLQLFKEEIDRNIIEINKKDAGKWVNGEDIKVEQNGENKFVIIKHNNNLIGCGKISANGEIKNYVPRERRIMVCCL